jgi:hypothetical protein
MLVGPEAAAVGRAQSVGRITVASAGVTGARRSSVPATGNTNSVVAASGRRLEQLIVEFPPTDEKLVRVYVRYMLQVGFLPRYGEAPSH